LEVFAPGAGLTSFKTQHQTEENEAFYTQAYWDITPQLQAIGGVRVTHEDVRMNPTSVDRLGSYGIGNLTPGPTILPGSQLDLHGEKNWDLVGYKGGLSYKISSDILSYFTYSHGFKSGGFNGRVQNPSDLGPFNPEYVNAYELGIKADLLGKKLRVNADLFLNNYTDQQLLTNHNSAFGNSSAIFNAGASQTKGAELEIQAAPFRGLKLEATAGYLLAHYVKFNPLIGGQIVSYAGFPLEYSPRWTGSIAASYSFATGAGTTRINVQYGYTGSQYTQPFTADPFNRIGSVGLVTAGLDWSPNADNWSVGAYCSNCLNKHYNSVFEDNPGYGDLTAFGDPAVYGVRARYRF
jgi:iron complex outermembrane receptor protein